MLGGGSAILTLYNITSRVNEGVFMSRGGGVKTKQAGGLK